MMRPQLLGYLSAPPSLLNSPHSCSPISPAGEALDSYNSPRPLSLSVVDFTGLCMMTIPSRWVDLDDPIVTKITLRDYSSAVLSIHLLLIRTEYIHDVRAVSPMVYNDFIQSSTATVGFNAGSVSVCRDTIPKEQYLKCLHLSCHYFPLHSGVQRHHNIRSQSVRRGGRGAQRHHST